ncbi:hypothetical protein K0M31_007185, partial [Melipona bicolor]
VRVYETLPRYFRNRYTCECWPLGILTTDLVASDTTSDTVLNPPLFVSTQRYPFQLAEQALARNVRRAAPLTEATCKVLRTFQQPTRGLEPTAILSPNYPSLPLSELLGSAERSGRETKTMTRSGDGGSRSRQSLA